MVHISIEAGDKKNYWKQFFIYPNSKNERTDPPFLENKKVSTQKWEMVEPISSNNQYLNGIVVYFAVYTLKNNKYTPEEIQIAIDWIYDNYIIPERQRRFDASTQSFARTADAFDGEGYPLGINGEPICNTPECSIMGGSRKKRGTRQNKKRRGKKTRQNKKRRGQKSQRYKIYR